MDNIDELSDEALITAIAGGAVWAMEPLYQRYSRILYSLVYRMVADHQVTEDLLQDSFLSVWRHASSYSPQSGAARSWLVRLPGKKLRWTSMFPFLMSGTKHGDPCKAHRYVLHS